MKATPGSPWKGQFSQQSRKPPVSEALFELIRLVMMLRQTVLSSIRALMHGTPVTWEISTEGEQDGM